MSWRKGGDSRDLARDDDDEGDVVWGTQTRMLTLDGGEDHARAWMGGACWMIAGSGAETTCVFFPLVNTYTDFPGEISPPGSCAAGRSTRDGRIQAPFPSLNAMKSIEARERLGPRELPTLNEESFVGMKFPALKRPLPLPASYISTSVTAASATRMSPAFFSNTTNMAICALYVRCERGIVDARLLWGGKWESEDVPRE